MGRGRRRARRAELPVEETREGVEILKALRPQSDLARIASVEEPVDEVPEPTSLLARPDAIAEWEATHDVLPVLRSLPPRQRQILAWTLAGFTPTDIAELLGLRAETVRANLMKARRSAAAYLTAREEEQ
ncbi:sigma factor-like helix-turn-helix DNA-binding protein [Streptomyces sp. NPDC006610]|uniref:sigma factor-like helix-turn-helix DNA-binding protein n=1 Tax=Streptomyces sp. NPDC006610 TaxID=3154584 RepID=UPI0033A9389A